MGRGGPTRRRREGRAGYRGEDRRTQVVDGSGVADGWWVAAGLTLAALVVASIVLVLFRRLGPMPTGGVAGLRSAAVALAAVLAVVSHLHWQTTGQLRSCRLSTAALLLAGDGIVTLVLSQTDLHPPLVWLGLALTVTAAAWVVWGLLGPEVDATARPAVEALVALAAVGLAWGLLVVLTPAGAMERAAGLTGYAALLAGVLWTVVAVIAVVRAVAATSQVMGWITWLAVAMATAAFARFGTWTHSPDWLGLAASATLWGMLLATLGMASNLGRSAVDRRGQLHAAAIHQQARGRVEDSRDRERAHEIRNALFAIEGATLALDRYGDELSASDRVELSAAVSRGIGHLRKLVEAGPEHRAPLALFPLVAGRAALVRARGIEVRIAGDEEVLALADDGLCSQIVDNLLANAVRHGDAARHGIEVHVDSHGDQVRVTVRDQGPGIPADATERIFDSGVRLDESREGDGLGLPLARALATRQGGSLVLEPGGPEGGATFVLSLPRADVPVEGRQGADDGQHLVEGRQAPPLGATGKGQGPAAAGGGLGVEEDDQISVHVRSVRRADRDVEPLRGDLGEQHDVDAVRDE